MPIPEPTDLRCHQTTTSLEGRQYICIAKPHPTKPDRHMFVRIDEDGYPEGSGKLGRPAPRLRGAL